jgi:hypothetical protein
MCKKLMFLISLVLVLGLSSSASADWKVWTAGYYPFSIIWDVNENWDPVGAPTSADTAWLHYSEVLPPAPSSVGPAIVGDMEVGEIGGLVDMNMWIVSGTIDIGWWWDMAWDGTPTGTTTLDMTGDATGWIGGIEGANKGHLVINVGGTTDIESDEWKVGDDSDATVEINFSGDASFEVYEWRLADNSVVTVNISDNASILCNKKFRYGDGDDGWLNLNMTGGGDGDDGWLNLNMTGGSLETGSGGFTCYDDGGGVLNVSGGSINVNSMGYSGRGGRTWELNVSGTADIVARENIRMGYNMEEEGGGATINMNGGSWSTPGPLLVWQGEEPDKWEALVVFNLNDGVISCGEFDNVGQFVVAGDATEQLEEDAAAGYITAYGVPARGELFIEYDPVEDETTVSAVACYACAYDPDPNDNATGIPSREDVVLSWSPGDGAVFHHVFFSDNYDDVATESAFAMISPPGGQTETSITVPNPFLLATTYYWRVVEDDGGMGLAHGLIWEFTIEESRAVEDMEEYSYNPDLIYDTWKDGCGDQYGLNGNGTGSCVDLWMANTHSGAKAMLYYYEVFKDLYKERDANYAEATRVFDAPLDLVSSGEKALVVWFCGDRDNGVTEMWLLLNDDVGTIAAYGDYGDDPADLTKEEWIDWNVKVSDLGPAAASVSSLSLGFGDRITGAEEPGIEGFVLFDDIEVYPTRCVPKYTPDITDITEDCKVDWEDVKTVCDDFLKDLR